MVFFKYVSFVKLRGPPLPIIFAEGQDNVSLGKDQWNQENNVLKYQITPVLQAYHTSRLLLFQVTHKIPESKELWRVFGRNISEEIFHLRGRLWTSAPSVIGTWPLLEARARKIAWLVELLILLLTSSSFAWSNLNLWVIFRYGLSCSSRINCSTTCRNQ